MRVVPEGFGRKRKRSGVLARAGGKNVQPKRGLQCPQQRADTAAYVDDAGDRNLEVFEVRSDKRGLAFDGGRGYGPRQRVSIETVVVGLVETAAGHGNKVSPGA